MIQNKFKIILEKIIMLGINLILLEIMISKYFIIKNAKNALYNIYDIYIL